MHVYLQKKSGFILRMIEDVTDNAWTPVLIEELYLSFLRSKKRASDAFLACGNSTARDITNVRTGTGIQAYKFEYEAWMCMSRCGFETCLLS